MKKEFITIDVPSSEGNASKGLKLGAEFDKSSDFFYGEGDVFPAFTEAVTEEHKATGDSFESSLGIVVRDI